MKTAEEYWKAFPKHKPAKDADIAEAMREYAKLYASEAIREKDKWISTKDRLPDHNVSVLVFIPEENDHITTGMWDISKKWVLLDEYRVPTCQVTYWREMVGMPEDKSYEQTHSNPDEMDTVTYKIRTLQKENYAKDKEIEQLRAVLENIALAVKHEASDLIVRTRLNTAFEVLSKNAHTESSGKPGQLKEKNQQL